MFKTGLGLFLDRLREVCREEALLTCRIFYAHEPTFLLLLWIFILYNINNLANFKLKFVHILRLIFISCFHLVEHTWRQVVSRGTVRHLGHFCKWSLNQFFWQNRFCFTIRGSYRFLAE